MFEMKANGRIQGKLTFFDIDDYLGLFDHLNASSKFTRDNQAISSPPTT